MLLLLLLLLLKIIIATAHTVIVVSACRFFIRKDRSLLSVFSTIKGVPLYKAQPLETRLKKLSTDLHTALFRPIVYDKKKVIRLTPRAGSRTRRRPTIFPLHPRYRSVSGEKFPHLMTSPVDSNPHLEFLAVVVAAAAEGAGLNVIKLFLLVIYELS